MIKKIGFVLLFSLFMGQFTSYAQLETKSISVFKNGTAFIHKIGKVPVQSGVYNWKDSLPNALYGTFWFSSNTGEITGISSSQVHGSVKRTWSNYLELLKANIGKQVVIETIDGKVLKGELYKAQGTFNMGTIVVKEANGTTILRDNQVKSARITGNLNEMVEVERLMNQISIQFKGNSKPQNLDVMYLTGGFSWTPMYKLDLINDSKGTLNMRASVVNDGESLNNVNLNLVVGSPNMYSTSLISDLVNFRKGRQPISYKPEARFGNSSSSFYEIKDKNSNGGGAPKVAEGIEDLYLFKINNVTLKHGGRAFYPIFNTDVKLEHKYVSTLNNNARVNNSYIRKYEAVTKGFPVSHELKVWNNSSNPLSSGTIMINSKSNGTSQALATANLPYTAINNCSYVTLSKSPDIEIKEEEKEVERTGRTKYWNKNKYVAVKVKSTVTIKSYKSKDVSMEINKLLYGELGESSAPWEKTGVQNHYYINEGNNVTWSFDLKAGSEVKITYTYTVFIRG